MHTPTRQAVQRMGQRAIILQLLTDRLVWRILVSRQHLRDAQRTIDEAESLLDWLGQASRRPRLHLVPVSDDEIEAAPAVPAAPGSDGRSRRSRVRNEQPSGPGSSSEPGEPGPQSGL